MGIGIPEVMVVLAICAVMLATVWPSARICRRAGLPPLLGVLSIVPIANVLLLWYVAFAAWPLAPDGGR